MMKWPTAALLFLAILVLMVANSSEFFLHQPFYEIDDWAANSISVDRAKHFSELYGNYSRWGFHHPGPAFFYLYALGEWLFYDTLHVVAAPFNGQLLVHLVLMTGYFVVILAVFSRALPRGGGPWFLPTALILSAMHFSMMADLAPDLSYTLHAPSAIASPWSAHALVMPILCLMTAGAAIAAGQGQYLPLLAFTDGCLIHTHVAQPLFIVPLSFLAYAGLCWRGWWKGQAPWREFPRAHVGAFLIVAVFALPIIGDFFRGSNSNFALILNHMRTHHGEHKPLMRSIFYFLQFGSYTEYTPYRNAFGHYDLPGAMVYLRHNALFYVMWLAAMALALRPLARSFRRRSAEDAAPDAVPPDTHRFLAWGAVFLIAGFGLTLFWGVIQDGPMTYFNAWFNYSFYQFTALLALASLCARPGAVVTDARRQWAMRLGGAAAVLAVCVVLAEPLRIYDPVPDAAKATRTAVQQAIYDANVPGQPRTKLLIFTQETWEIATGIALQLSRAGQPFVVLPQWVIVVGEQHRWKDFPDNTSLERLEIFRLHARHAETAKQPAYALPKVGAALTIVPSVIDPADESRSVIEFRPDGNNFLGFQVIGWSAREDWGTWNDGHVALLAFHPKSAGGSDVEMRLNVIPLLAPKYGLTEQIVRVFFNGEQVESERVFSQVEPAMTFTIPSELWERAASEPSMIPATLEFRFPNAVAPRLIDPENPNNDPRTLAVGFRQIQFRKADAPPPAENSQMPPHEEVHPPSTADDQLPPGKAGPVPSTPVRSQEGKGKRPRRGRPH